MASLCSLFVKRFGKNSVVKLATLSTTLLSALSITTSLMNAVKAKQKFNSDSDAELSKGVVGSMLVPQRCLHSDPQNL